MSQLFSEAILLLVLIVANGVFALSEIALVSARKTRLEQLAGSGNRGAHSALKLLEDPSRFLSTVQVGITLISTVAGVFGGARFAKPLGAWFAGLGVPETWSDDAALVLVVIVISYLSLTIGELVPKRIAMSNPERFSLLVAGPMRGLSRLTSPLVSLLSFSTDMLLRLVPLKGDTSSAVTEEDIRALIHQGAQMGVLKPEEQDMLDRLLRLDDRRVSVLMTPRRDIVCLTEEMTQEAISLLIAEHQYSRYPLCGEGVDDVLGIVHVRDLAAALGRGTAPVLREILQQPLHIMDTTRALALLRQFKETGVHVAIVQDEYGGVQGLVTINDIFESIVGSLPEAGEAEDPDIVVRDDGSWLVDGGTPIDEMRRVVPQCAALFAPGGGYETVGGFVMTLLGRIPKAGDSFESEGVRFEVVDMDERRVDKVLVELLDGEKEEAEAARADG